MFLRGERIQLRNARPPAAISFSKRAACFARAPYRCSLWRWKTSRSRSPLPRPVLPWWAAVADPFDDAVFWADGKRASRRAGGRDTPLAPSARSNLIDLNIDPPFPSAPDIVVARLTHADEFLKRFKPRIVSSSIALAWVATGQRAAYVTDGDLRDNVHFAAGLALCEAAGCTLTDLRGGPIGQGPTGLIAAADVTTHAALLALVQSARVDGAAEPLQRS